MRKPVNVIYGVDETPPAAVFAGSALQQAAVMAVYLIYPVLIARAAGGDVTTVSGVVSVSLLALAFGSVLQAMPRAGAGFLCPPVLSAVYLVPSLLAARRGGLPLVCGMTVLAGLLEMVLSRTLRHLRPLFPPEVTGLVVTLVGMATGAVGARTLLTPAGPESYPAHLAASMLTLGTIIALNVWSRGPLRLFCVLIGMVVGYAAAAVLGGISPADRATFASGALVALPPVPRLAWTLDGDVLVAFAVAAFAAALKTVATITTCQKLGDADWKRPDMASVSRGVLADGLATVGAGLLGGVGVNSGTTCVALASATGVMSRRVAYGIGGILLALAFLPKLGALLYLMPNPVAGAALLFAGAFLLVNGVELMTSRLLDARRTLVIGLPFLLGLSVDLYPALYKDTGGKTPVLFGSSLVLGTVASLLLNLLFRLGVRRRETLAVAPGPGAGRRIEDFIEAQGARWGARRDVIDRAGFNLAQSVETIADSCEPQGPLTVEARFDEFNLDLTVSYRGAPLELPERRPTNEEIMGSDEGQRRLAGYLLRRLADRVQAAHEDGTSTILFHFDH